MNKKRSVNEFCIIYQQEIKTGERERVGVDIPTPFSCVLWKISLFKSVTFCTFEKITTFFDVVVFPNVNFRALHLNFGLRSTIPSITTLSNVMPVYRLID
jgi:hypothetical protein